MTPRKKTETDRTVSKQKKVAKPGASSKASVTQKKTTAKKTNPSVTQTPAVKTAKQKTTLAKSTTKPDATKQSSMPTDKPAMKPTDPPTKTDSEKKTQTLKSNKPTTAKQKKLFNAKELEEFYQAMIGLRGRLTVQVAGLREQSLMRHDEVNQNEDGTDAFDRVTNLDRASGDQSRINQINTAIRMIEEGTYGLCEQCGEKIEKPRLQALPFAKSCIKCQSAMEGSSGRQRPSIDLLD